jgi:hypothetical protein
MSCRGADIATPVASFVTSLVMVDRPNFAPRSEERAVAKGDQHVAMVA